MYERAFSRLHLALLGSEISPALLALKTSGINQSLDSPLDRLAASHRAAEARGEQNHLLFNQGCARTFAA